MLVKVMKINLGHDLCSTVVKDWKSYVLKRSQL